MQSLKLEDGKEEDMNTPKTAFRVRKSKRKRSGSKKSGNSKERSNSH
jgi:hypothetical protein